GCNSILLSLDFVCHPGTLSWCQYTQFVNPPPSMNPPEPGGGASKLPFKNSWIQSTHENSTSSGILCRTGGSLSSIDSTVIDAAPLQANPVASGNSYRTK